MKKNKKVILHILGILIILFLVGSVAVFRYCNKPIVLEFGMFTGSNWDVANADSFVIIDNAIEEFEKEHPGVKIHYYSGVSKEDYSEWFSRKLLQGEEPDVFMILSKDFSQFSTLGIMKDLNHFIEQDASFDKSKYFTSSYRSGTYNGKQYALPYETVPTLMFVNKTLLSEAGISVPDYDWGWKEMYSICEYLSNDGDEDTYGIYNYDWQDSIYTNNCEIFNEDGSKGYFTDYNFVESIKYVYQLEQLNQGKKLTRDEFDDGKVAFMPLTFAEYRTYKTYPYRIRRYTDFQWDCITMPAGYHGDNVSRVDTLLMGISAKSEYPELAWEFLKLLTYDEEIQMQIFEYSQGASVLKDVTQSEEMEKIIQEDMEEGDTVISGELLGQVIEGGHIDPKFRKYRQAISLVDNEITNILETDKTIDSSLKILTQSMEEYLEIEESSD